MIGAFARRAPDLEQRRSLVGLGAPFERMTTIAVPLTVISGLGTLMLFGYSIFALWVLATGLINLVMVAIQILFWNRVGPHLHEALGRGDDEPRRICSLTPGESPSDGSRSASPSDRRADGNGRPRATCSSRATAAGWSPSTTDLRSSSAGPPTTTSRATRHSVRCR